jgi:hypothetical protein
MCNYDLYGTYRLPCFALLVLLVAAAKIHFEEQALVAGTKQSRKADMADRLASQAGWQGWQACLLCFGPACFVLCPLLALAHLSGFCTNTP